MGVDAQIAYRSMNGPSSGSIGSPFSGGEKEPNELEEKFKWLDEDEKELLRPDYLFKKKYGITREKVQLILQKGELNTMFGRKITLPKEIGPNYNKECLLTDKQFKEKYGHTREDQILANKKYHNVIRDKTFNKRGLAPPDSAIGKQIIDYATKIRQLLLIHKNLAEAIFHNDKSKAEREKILQEMFKTFIPENEILLITRMMEESHGSSYTMDYLYKSIQYVKFNKFEADSQESQTYYVLTNLMKDQINQHIELGKTIDKIVRQVPITAKFIDKYTGEKEAGMVQRFFIAKETTASLILKLLKNYIQITKLLEPFYNLYVPYAKQFLP